MIRVRLDIFDTCYRSRPVWVAKWRALVKVQSAVHRTTRIAAAQLHLNFCKIVLCWSAGLLPSVLQTQCSQARTLWEMHHRLQSALNNVWDTPKRQACAVRCTETATENG